MRRAKDGAAMRSLCVALLALGLVGCGGKAVGYRATGAMRLKAGDVAGAVAELRAAGQTDPADPAAWALLGDALFEAQRYEEAEKSYRSALELDHQDASVRRRLAQLAIRRGRVPEAERLLREIVSHPAGNSDAQIALGTLLAAR